MTARILCFVAVVMMMIIISEVIHCHDQQDDLIDDGDGGFGGHGDNGDHGDDGNHGDGNHGDYGGGGGVDNISDDDDGDDDFDGGTDNDSCGIHLEKEVRRVLRRCTDFMWKNLGLAPISKITVGCLVPGQIIDRNKANILADACTREMERRRCSSDDDDDSGSSSSSSSGSCDDSDDNSKAGDDDDDDDDDDDKESSDGEIQLDGSTTESEDSDDDDDGGQMRSKRIKRSLASSLPSYWWNLPIYYWFSLEQSGSIDIERVKTEVRRSISFIQSSTCVNFVETSSNPQLVFYISSSCASYTGKRANNAINSIFLGPECQYSSGQILHLLVQALGFFNEHQRWDRDDYISINTINIVTTRLDSFISMPRSIATTFDLFYDYHSIMHQPQLFLSSNGEPTLLTKDPFYQFGIGQRVQLSFTDNVAINKLYCSNNCNGRTTPSCSNGGVQDSKLCEKCSCPDGFAGIYCQDVQVQSTAECSTNTIDLTSIQSATIQSPGYDNVRSYSSGVSCTWIVKALPASIITATFTGEFGIFCKNASSCQHWVELRYKKPFYRDGPRFCCNFPQTSSLTSEDNEMMILFRTYDVDGIAGVNRGFKLNLRTSRPCPAWSIQVDVNSVGGRRIPSSSGNPVTLELCKSSCLSQSDCLGFDFSLSTSSQDRCYIYTDQSAFSVKFSTAGVIQYQLDRSNCPMVFTNPTNRNQGVTSSTTTTSTPSTTSTTTVATTTTTTLLTSTTMTTTTTKYTPPTTTSLTSTSTSTTTTTTLNPPCYRWVEMVDTQSIGGVQVFQISSLEACRSYCISQQDACVAFAMDLNPPTPTCWTYGGLGGLWPVRNNKLFLFLKRRCDEIPLPCPEPKISFDASSNGGTKVTGATTPTAFDCFSSCNDSTVQCYGFDFNYVDLSCWLHLDFYVLGQSYHNAGVLQVVFQKPCPLRQETSTVVITTIQTNPIFPTAQAGSCPQWRFTPDTSSPGGDFVFGKSSLSDCIAYCQDYKPCVGLDFQSRTNPQECWIHTNANVMSHNYPNPGVQQGVLERCPTTTTTTTTAIPSTTSVGIVPPDRNSCPYWTVKPGTSSMGGVYQAQYTTIQSCLDYCLSVDTCGGLDFRDSQCWSHTEQSIQYEVANPFVTQIKIIDRCHSPTTRQVVITTSTTVLPTMRQDLPCRPDWSKRNGIHSPGAEYANGIWNEDDCMAKCLLMPNCVAIDFNWVKSPGECWVHTNVNDLQVTYQDFSINQQVLVKRCPDSGAATCENKWLVRYGYYSPGGQLRASLRSIMDCLDACIGDVTCVGVDVDSSGLNTLCTLHVNVMDYLYGQSDARLTQYRMSSRCPTQYIPSTCQDTWVVRKSIQSTGANKVATPLKLLECLSNCSSTSYCVGSEFNTATNPPECWLHYDVNNFNRKISNPSITQYQLVDRCLKSWERVSGSCGGYQANPGQINPPCITINKPITMCNVAITTFENNGRGWTLRYTNNIVPCSTPMCISPSQLVNFGNTPVCAVIGWSPWLQCNKWCGNGVQFRYFYSITNGEYQTTNEEQRSCNSQPCR